MKVIITKPVVSEKSISQGVVSKYTFVVNADSTKPQVKGAIKQLFKVDVDDVNIINTPGKVKMFKRRKGQRSDIKKAVVTLKAGQKINLFEEAK
jgi:large subunit ribosomal protein L23